MRINVNPKSFIHHAENQGNNKEHHHEISKVLGRHNDHADKKPILFINPDKVKSFGYRLDDAEQFQHSCKHVISLFESLGINVVIKEDAIQNELGRVDPIHDTGKVI